MGITVVESISGCRDAVAAARRAGKTISFVPTMGALHEGHAALVRAAAGLPNSFTVVSIFVNPTQFGPNEDYSRYPRTLDADRTLCDKAGAELIFLPPVESMYPPQSRTFVDVGELGDHLCGASRPGHFRGVCTVVMKLFHIVAPDAAFFGAKDAQQARILWRMVLDLDYPLDFRIVPTVREPDGLALSSRNRYLSPEERAVAPRIFAALTAIHRRATGGEIDATRLESALRSELEAIPGARVDYATIVDEETLQPVRRLDRPALVAVAVFLGRTRLIDNLTLA